MTEILLVTFFCLFYGCLFQRHRTVDPFAGVHCGRECQADLMDALKSAPRRATQVWNDECEDLRQLLHLGNGKGFRILYRSREKGVVLLNSKAGDFESYSLPRLSVQNWENEQEAPSNSDGSRRSHRYDSRIGKSSDLSSKPKVKFKTPCLNVDAKTKPASRSNITGPGI